MVCIDVRQPENGETFAQWVVGRLRCMRLRVLMVFQAALLR